MSDLHLKTATHQTESFMWIISRWIERFGAHIYIAETDSKPNANVSVSRISTRVTEITRVEPIVQIVNVVASGSFDHGIDLEAISKTFPDSEYKPKGFPGLVLRLKRPKTSSLLFSSGKIICTVGRSEKTAVSAIRKIVRMLKKQGIVIKGNPTIKIQNVVASVDLGGRVSLDDFYMESGREGSAMYEPDQFPGLIYRMKDPKVVMLVFSSGKAVCTGAKNEAEVHLATQRISKLLEKHEFISYRPIDQTAPRWGAIQIPRKKGR